jgi:ATP-dependent Zn protease
MRTIPEIIVSTTAGAGNDGFVFTNFRWNYVSRKEITRRLALYLAGYAAEKVVFGEENVTTGAEEDIEKATSFITHMLKQCGMGKQIGSFHAKHPGTREYLDDFDGQLNK